MYYVLFYSITDTIQIQKIQTYFYQIQKSQTYFYQIQNPNFGLSQLSIYI